jgi:hypothetical protein
MAPPILTAPVFTVTLEYHELVLLITFLGQLSRTNCFGVPDEVDQIINFMRNGTTTRRAGELGWAAEQCEVLTRKFRAILEESEKVDILA